MGFCSLENIDREPVYFGYIGQIETKELIGLLQHQSTSNHFRQKLVQFKGIRKNCPVCGFYLRREREDWNVYVQCSAFKGLLEELVSVSLDLER